MQSTARERGINTGLGNGAGEVRSEDRTKTRTRQRFSISQRMTHPTQTAVITARVTTKASTINRGADVGRRMRAARGSRAPTPATSSSGADRSELMRGTARQYLPWATGPDIAPNESARKRRDASFRREATPGTRPPK